MDASSASGNRRGQSPARCARCRMLARVCLCAELQARALATRVLVVGSRREFLQPTNTGRLVGLALLGSAVLPRSVGEEPLSATDLGEPGRRTLLLYPAPGARVLAREPADPRAVTLVVPDGNWREARKLARREPALAALERVQLPHGPPSRYRLRSHPDARFLATFEAVARALGILEGPELQAELERVFVRFVERTLWSRGRLRAAHVTGGLPPTPAGS